MKPAVTSIACAILLGGLFYAIGRPLQLIDYVIILFATSIVVWTFEQYSHHRQH
jgi:hypothetical protein